MAARRAASSNSSMALSRNALMSMTSIRRTLAHFDSYRVCDTDNGFTMLATLHVRATNSRYTVYGIARKLEPTTSPSRYSVETLTALSLTRRPSKDGIGILSLKRLADMWKDTEED